MPTVLIVDDDAHIVDVIQFALEQAGFATRVARCGEEALVSHGTVPADAIVLDVMMPGIDGTQVCRRIREHSRVPILFVTARDDEIDRVLGLELGGDDYVTKPFSPRELVARIKAILRRTSTTASTNASSSAVVACGALHLDCDDYTVAVHGSRVPLTLTEFGILRTLMNRPGRVFRRGELVTQAYEDAVAVSDRTVDSHVRRIRAKLREAGSDPIETVHGIGYKLRAP